MFNKVLVGIDPQTRGRDAIALAERLVSPSGKLILAHVHPGFALPAKGDNGAFEAVEQEAGLELLQSVSEQIGRDVELTYTGDDRVGTGLRRLAERSSADLLVLGSSPAGHSGQVLLAPQTRHSIDGAPCAVAVAPTGYADLNKPIREIGVAYNGSRESHVALELTRRLASELRATADVFEAVPLPTYGVTPEGWETAEDAIYDSCRVRRANLAHETGLHAHVGCGNTAEQIALFSSMIDLLVMGSRDSGPLGRLVHGSTTHKLLCSAHSPVLILTRAALTSASARESRDIAELTA